MPTPVDLPEYYLSTYNMISCAFPDGITDEDYMPLVAILREEGQMSFRSIARFFTFVTNRGYPQIYNDALFSESNPPNQSEIVRVKYKLILCGYEQWVDAP
ncbi:MAG: DUF3349 domain-containing protein [Chloroflexi bacterium]|nr:DUF3349 domain-containing protein [Chloroflexota bacterium]